MNILTQINQNKPALKAIEVAFYRHYSLIEVLDLINYAAIVPSVPNFEPADIVAICLVGSLRASDDAPITLDEAWERAQEYLPTGYFEGSTTGQTDDKNYSFELLEGGKR